MNEWQERQMRRQLDGWTKAGVAGAGRPVREEPLRQPGFALDIDVDTEPAIRRGFWREKSCARERDERSGSR